MKIEKLPLKTKVILGVIEALVMVIGLALWDYYKGDELQYLKYIFQGVLFALLMSWMFKYKIVKENK